MIKYNTGTIGKYTVKELGISYDSYNRIMKNEEVSLKVLLRIANTLGISLKELMWYEEEN